MMELPVSVRMVLHEARHPFAQPCWRAAEVSLGEAGPSGEAAQRWVPGLVLQLTPDEASGYEHNLAAAHPKVFVLCRPEGDAAVPVRLTASYDAGLRMLDSGEQVDAVPLPAPMAAIVARYVEQNWARVQRDRQGERTGPRGGKRETAG